MYFNPMGLEKGNSGYDPASSWAAICLGTGKSSLVVRESSRHYPIKLIVSVGFPMLTKRLHITFDVLSGRVIDRL